MRFLRNIVRRQSFHPGFLGLFVNPFYFARKGLRRHIGDLAHHISGVTLDVGAGTQPYRELFTVSDYVSLEYDTPENRRHKRADFFYDGETFPFPANHFDSVVLFEVLEHVFNPDRFLSEIHRVLKPGGKVLMTVPMIWDEHEQPYDYARYSSFGIAHLLSQHSLVVEVQLKSVNDISVIFQLLNGYVYKKAIGAGTLGNLVIVLLLTAPVNLMGTVLAAIMPKNNDLYLDNVVLSTKPMD